MENKGLEVKVVCGGLVNLTFQAYAVTICINIQGFYESFYNLSCVLVKWP